MILRRYVFYVYSAVCVLSPIVVLSALTNYVLVHCIHLRVYVLIMFFEQIK